MAAKKSFSGTKRVTESRKKSSKSKKGGTGKKSQAWRAYTDPEGFNNRF